ncbi:hypothetical protein XSR1_650011 [Xenorhabdus szentirmaii DSM 16338]|uniref:Uncharacterized protein n=1 Tax=Xenorhabdus szentirmaii DSM 16338 TaxID=1427518 RepID=W1J389_9GAMM|nr:hypothetical protein XSR1_650011 [Xenorhabdus szentirmaii DSM 16338]
MMNVPVKQGQPYTEFGSQINILSYKLFINLFIYIVNTIDLYIYFVFFVYFYLEFQLIRCCNLSEMC